MNIKEALVMAFQALNAHKMRAVLTTLGIIIAITAIIGAASILQGLGNYLDDTLNILGSNTFQVQKFPAIQFGPRDRERYLKRKDISLRDALSIEERAVFVRGVGPETWRFGVSVKYGNKKTNPTMQLAGGVPAFFENNGEFVAEGRAITDIDVQRNRQVIVLGTDVSEFLFPKGRAVGKFVTVRGYRFQVIGVLEKQGSAFGASRDSDSVIPLTTHFKIFGKRRSLNITIQAKSAEVMEKAIEEVTTIMRVSHKLHPGEENDFEVFTNNSLIDTFDSLKGYTLLGTFLICGMSLLVGGIGIMNIMLVSVTERTKEIGIRKAIGAKKRDVLRQFVFEAVVISMFGGIIGILLGFGIAKLITLTTPLPASDVPMWALLTGLFFSTGVGLIFGIYPAWKASKLSPIVALRFE